MSGIVNTIAANKDKIYNTLSKRCFFKVATKKHMNIREPMIPVVAIRFKSPPPPLVIPMPIPSPYVSFTILSANMACEYLTSPE